MTSKTNGRSAAGAGSSGWRRAGPPRKVDHRTGAGAPFARAVAMALPQVGERTRSGRTSFSVTGRTFATVDPGEESLVVTTATGDRHHLLLRTIGRDEIRTRIEEAWAEAAPKPAVAAWQRRRAQREKEPAITQEDARRIILSLPGATEGPIWGQDVGFLIGTEKRTRFARFGPPEGGRVANLLAPDDEGTLVLFHCEQKPELLASSPERFFTTPHYGDPGEPGGIIIRLSEHRGPTELAELTELIEEAWRHVAPPDLVGQLEGKRAEPPG